MKIYFSVGATTGQRDNVVKRLLFLCNSAMAQLADALISCDNLLEVSNPDVASIKQKTASFRFQINFISMFITPIRRINSIFSSDLFKVFKALFTASPKQILFASSVRLPIEKAHSLPMLSLISKKVFPAFFWVFVWHRDIIL